MKIAILIGSSKHGRQSHKTAYYMGQKLQERGFLCDIIDPCDKPCCTVEACTGCCHQEPVELHDISARLEAADGLLLVTPEYRGSFASVLKTVLDRVWTNFTRKPVGVVVVTAVTEGGMHAGDQLQQMMLGLHAIVVPYRLIVPQSQTAFTSQFTLRHEKTILAAGKFLDVFCWFFSDLYQKCWAAQDF